MSNNSFVSKVSYDIVFVQPSEVQPGIHLPKLGGRYLKSGQIQVYSAHIRILQEAFGWTYYLGYLFGILGYFLTPLFGSFTFKAYIHKVRWEDIKSVRFDSNSGTIQFCGLQDDGKTWLWTFGCAKAMLLLRQLS